MSTARPAGFGLIFLGACIAYGLGCSSSSTGGAPADAGVSTGAGGSRSTGITTATGTTLVGTGAAGSGTVTGAGGSGGSGSGTSQLGAACKADGDCGTGLICLKSSDNLSSDPQSPGGPGLGLCTVDCTVNQSACAPLGGICIAVDSSQDAGVTRAFCFESCAIGPNPPAPPVAKCHSRDEVVCEPVNSAETVFACVPLCVTDADCGTRKCEPLTGLCVDTPFPGKPNGSGCTVNTGMASTECAGGFCLPIEAIPDGGTTAPGICTALCNLGAADACGFRLGSLDAGPPEGACLLPWGNMGYNSGDLGLCLQLCDSPNDCSYHSADWTCRTDTPVAGTGHAVCLPPPPG